MPLRCSAADALPRNIRQPFAMPRYVFHAIRCYAIFDVSLLRYCLIFATRIADTLFIRRAPPLRRMLPLIFFRRFFADGGCHAAAAIALCRCRLIRR